MIPVIPSRIAVLARITIFIFIDSRIDLVINNLFVIYDMFVK